MFTINSLSAENRINKAKSSILAHSAGGDKLLITPNKFTQFGAKKCNTLSPHYPLHYQAFQCPRGVVRRGHINGNYFTFFVPV